MKKNSIFWKEKLNQRKVTQIMKYNLENNMFLEKIKAVKNMQRQAEFFCAETAKKCDEIMKASRDR